MGVILYAGFKDSDNFEVYRALSIEDCRQKWTSDIDKTAACKQVRTVAFLIKREPGNQPALVIV